MTPCLLAVLAVTLTLFALRRRAAHPALLLIGLALSPGCDGCHTTNSPRPLQPDEYTRFYVSDRLGSTALVTDREGQVVAREAHEPFGEPWVRWRATERPAATYGYTGKEHEPVSGALAVGIRHYLPALGRWASPDPLTLTAPTPDALATSERNPLSFAANNPLRAADVSGLCVDCKVEHQIKAKWTPELRAAHARHQQKQAKETARTLETIDNVLNDFELAMLGAGPPGMALAGVESATLHMAVRGARLLMRAERVARGASATSHAIKTLRLPKAVGADVKLVRLRHYTRKSSIKSIKSDNLLRASDRNGVFATSARKKPMSAQDARAKLRIKGGKGGAHVEFDASPMEYTVETIQKTGEREYILRGNVDLSGRNPTFHKND